MDDAAMQYFLHCLDFFQPTTGRNTQRVVL